MKLITHHPVSSYVSGAIPSLHPYILIYRAFCIKPHASLFHLALNLTTSERGLYRLTFNGILTPINTSCLLRHFCKHTRKVGLFVRRKILNFPCYSFGNAQARKPRISSEEANNSEEQRSGDLEGCIIHCDFAAFHKRNVSDFHTPWNSFALSYPRKFDSCISR